MEINDTMEVQIESLAFGGDGVARAEGLVIFVPGVLPGESVSIEIKEKKSNFARGKALKVLQPSDDRIPSPCPYFLACGGCQYLHVKYDAQLEAKKRQVEDLLRRVGKVEFPTVQTVPCPEPFYYRNRIKLHVLRKDKAIQVGFIHASGHGVVPIDQCIISAPAINAALPAVRDQLKKSQAAKTMSLRSTLDGKVDVWTENLPISKENTLKETIRDKVFEAPSTAFFQVHPAMTEMLVTEVERHLPPAADVLIDAYCGVGLFSGMFGKRFKEIVGIEQDQSSVRWARKNMRQNGVEFSAFYEGKTERLIEKALEKTKNKSNVVILDPPRDGLDKDIPKFLCAARPEQIIYISCNPATLARDLGRLSPTYKTASVTLVDMFPQTMHCEVVVNLRLA